MLTAMVPIAAALVVLAGLRVARRPAPRAYEASPQRREGRFRNPAPRPAQGLRKTLGIIWNVLTNKPADAVPDAPLPIQRLTRAQLDAAPDRSLYRLGHSTVLLKLRGGFWLTDPVFAERASPFRWMGPKRFHAPPIALDELPPIRGVVLSHDHYDHLDRQTIAYLADRVDVFLTPLGVGDRLVAWGVDADKVRQLDWWQETEVDGIRFVATPAQHFSGRGMFDGDRTLWASWSILDDELRVFFSGDTGYFAGFEAIGERLGPFDVTLIETGAYDAQWPYVHMQPAESVQAHLDLRGRWMVPIHNGTFDLALHRWQDPFEQVSALASSRGVALSTPRMGERLDLAAPHAGERWWRLLEAPAAVGAYAPVAIDSDAR